MANGYGGGYPPQGGGYGGGYPPQGGYNDYPPRNSSSGCLKALLILGVIAAVLLGMTMCTVAVVAGGDDGDGDSADPGTSQSQGSGSNGTIKKDTGKKGSGPTFKGKTDDDTSTGFGKSISKDGVSIMVSKPVFTKEAILGSSAICSDVTITNDSKDQKSFNLVDWSFQGPDGVSKMVDTPLDGGGLGYGEIAPGASTRGKICMDSTSQKAMPKGEYVALYNDIGNIFSSGRLAWVGNVA